MMSAVVISVMIMVVIVKVIEALAAVIAVGTRQRRNTGQDDSKRHRRCRGEKTLRVHMDAPECSHHNACESYPNRLPTIRLG